MITQVVIRLDTKVKAKALKRAKREGVVFTDILKRAAESFAEGDFPGYSDEIRPEKLKQWEKASRDYDKGKGRTFNSVEELREHWKKL